MTSPPRESPPRKARGRRGRRPSRFRTFLGVPNIVILIAVVLSVLLGIQLANALQTSTTSSSTTASTTVEGATGAGRNASGLTVITESTLGAEVQRLVDTGTIQPMASFDASQCLREQGSQDSLLIMEEVAWGPEQTAAWLLIHGPMDRDTLRASGGTVSATVVLPTCGTAGDDGSSPQESRLWSGRVMIGGV